MTWTVTTSRPITSSCWRGSTAADAAVAEFCQVLRGLGHPPLPRPPHPGPAPPGVQLLPQVRGHPRRTGVGRQELPAGHAGVGTPGLSPHRTAGRRPGGGGAGRGEPLRRLPRLCRCLPPRGHPRRRMAAGDGPRRAPRRLHLQPGAPRSRPRAGPQGRLRLLPAGLPRRP